jgi:hypothetical protein
VSSAGDAVKSRAQTPRGTRIVQPETSGLNAATFASYDGALISIMSFTLIAITM